jgi:hypothetical protein
MSLNGVLTSCRPANIGGNVQRPVAVSLTSTDEVLQAGPPLAITT